MTEHDGWHNALQHLKIAYKDESTVSNIATANFADDTPPVEKMELQNIDENWSYHSSILISSDKYEMGTFDNDFGFGGMNGIIDVSSIYGGDDDSDINKLHITQQDLLELDISELKSKPTQDVEFDKAENLIYATEDLSAGSGSETDGSSIILNVWNEDYDGRPDPEVMKKLIEAKKLPRGLDPVVLTQIKRARIINKLRELDDDDSSQGSCGVMINNICMPRFCGNGELTDEESLGNSLVDSLKEGSTSASVDLDFFHHKRPKRSQYALVPDNQFNPNKSPEDLVLMLPKKGAEDNFSVSGASSFLPIQQAAFDDDSECQGTYIETEKEFTLQKYDRAPHRIAELVLSGKKSEAPQYNANETNSTVETTPSRKLSFVAKKQIPLDLDPYVLKMRRSVRDEDPVESDRSVICPFDEIAPQEIEQVEEGPLSEFVKLFSDPNYLPPPPPVKLFSDPPFVEEEKDIHPEEVIVDKFPEEQMLPMESQIVCARVHLDENAGDEGPTEPMLATIACINNGTEVVPDHAEPIGLSVNEVPVTFSDKDVNEREIGPGQTTSSLTETDECSLNPVGSSFEKRIPDTLENSNPIRSEDSQSPESSYSFNDQENCAPSLNIATEIKSTDQKTEVKDFEEPAQEDLEHADDRNEQVYVEDRRTLSIATIINSSLDAPTNHPKHSKLLPFTSCCNPIYPLPTTAKTEDGMKDLMNALDLTLEGVNTASYSTAGGEEVVMAMPVEGIIAEQPDSNYGRIISPEEFEKLQESLCKSMNLDDSMFITSLSLDVEVGQESTENINNDVTSDKPHISTHEAHNLDEIDNEPSLSSTETIEAEAHNNEEKDSASEPSNSSMTVMNPLDGMIETQMSAVSHVSTDIFYDTIDSPSCLSPTVPKDQQSTASFGVFDETKVDDIILDIIDNLKDNNASSPKEALGETGQEVVPKETSIDNTETSSDTKLGPAEIRNLERKTRRRKKKTKRSGKKSRDSKSKADDASIVDDLVALRKTIAKNSIRSKSTVRSGAKSLGLASNSLLDSVSQTTKKAA